MVGILEEMALSVSGVMGVRRTKNVIRRCPTETKIAAATIIRTAADRIERISLVPGCKTVLQRGLPGHSQCSRQIVVSVLLANNRLRQVTLSQNRVSPLLRPKRRNVPNARAEAVSHEEITAKMYEALFALIITRLAFNINR